MGGIGVLAARLITPALTLAFCIGFLQSISGMSREAADYPRLMIVLLLVLVLANGAFEVVSWLKDRRAGALDALPRPRELWTRWHRAVVTIGLLAGYTYIIPRLGFYPATTVFLALLLPSVGLRRPLPLVAMISGLLVMSYALFSVVLDVILPRGPFS